MFKNLNQKNNDSIRVEKDSIGKKEIAADSYYGINTIRAQENFNISRQNIHPELVKAISMIKKAAALSNFELGLLDEIKKNAILEACDEMIDSNLAEKLELDAFQGGAGTSTNMMVNEVIANRALEIMGMQKGDYDIIHPNDDVNKGQSTNDVYPTALRIAVLKLLGPLTKSIAKLQEVLQVKEEEFSSIIKLGRTQLQDAVPITLGQEFSAYAEAVNRDRWRLYKITDRLKKINLGGTAIGTGLNTSHSYIFKIAKHLRNFTSLSLSHSENMIDITQNMDIFVEVSGLLKAASVNLNKIASDLRLLASGPTGGIGEIKLPAVQAGSSIMPGKVNPVICEMINQLSIEIICSDQAITMAARDGQLELNAFSPIIAQKLLNMLEMMKKAIDKFNNKCVKDIEVNSDKCKQILDNSLAIITSLVPYIGYEQASDLAKEAVNQDKKLIDFIKEKDIISNSKLDKILKLENMTSPGNNLSE
ncbi:Aspartate ammonia-lyase [Halanaerobium saccharolyticum subsp. saccharolyticum DSM 6643]|uniref:Aspartate ammonia-lyase n=1 Tax=Halanaerobium saccharolyticum subsp. saccharolyticum DSM 6643 TaxID=1293054 RepID=M5DXR5_9FIRM|nr:aspartate ammonia-lyase [Halanaerobium saccharolyticum]CCU78144.1 Aspartate ammonia-lyase [Halanaerobium saccharolyticum subsp. saccharolyticum DSM 6643]